MSKRYYDVSVFIPKIMIFVNNLIIGYKYTLYAIGGVYFFMEKMTKYRSVTVQAKDADEFDRKFDEVSEKIDEPVELQWDTAPMCVHFIYKEIKRIPETVEDEFKIQGLQYYCKDCPYLEKGRNRREKSHGCKYAEYGNVTDFSPACEMFYKLVKQGKIKVED